MKRLILIILSIGLGVAAAALLGGLLWRAVPVAARPAQSRGGLAAPFAVSLRTGV